MKLNFEILSKTKNRIIILIILVVVIACIFYFFYNSKLNYYKCNSEFDAKVCSQCKIQDKFKIDFILNKNNGLVMNRTFFNVKRGEVVTSNINENCKIFDDKNWDCSRLIDMGSHFLRISEGMTNGVYHYYSFTKSIYDADSAFCAK